ncbi:MAG: hypothetical protein JWN01_988 [Patescibacteria group bacterium]|nr:hypothetical protein [Patescibacteria group bacterium]
MITLENRAITVRFKGQGLKVSVLMARRSDEWVVALHGVQSNGELFADLFQQEFLAGYSLLAISFVGFGDSGKPEDFSYDVQDQAGVVKLVLDELGVKRLHLIGHSLGGMVGTLLLKQLGGRVMSFSNLEGNLVLADCGASKDVAQLSLGKFEQTGYAQMKDKVKGSGEKSASFRSRWLEMIPAFVFYKTSVSIVEWSQSEKLLGLFNGSEVRRLFIYGEKNAYKAEVVSDLVEKAEIPGAGHFMLLDDPAACYRGLGTLLAKSKPYAS